MDATCTIQDSIHVFRLIHKIQVFFIVPHNIIVQISTILPAITQYHRNVPGTDRAFVLFIFTKNLLIYLPVLPSIIQTNIMPLSF